MAVTRTEIGAQRGAGSGGGGAGSDTTAIHDDTAGEIAAVAEKLVPVGADVLLIEDSAAANAKKRLAISNLPAGAPVLHAASHENGGGDEVSVAGLSGLLADAQTPAAHTHGTADVTSGTFADARIAASNVTQHQASLSVTESQITDLSHTAAGGDGTDTTAIHDDTAGEVAAITTKAVLVGADVLLVEDSAAANAKKSSTVAGLRITESQVTDLAHTAAGGDGTDTTAIHDDTAGEIAAVAAKAVLVAADTILVEDSAAANAKKSSTVGGLRITESQITDLAHTAAGGAGTDTTAIHDDTAGEIAAVTSKAVLVGADVLLVEDSAAANVKKSSTVAGLRITESQITDLAHIAGDFQSTAVASFATTNAAFQTAASLVTPALTGTYRIAMTTIMENADELGEVRLQNTTDAVTIGDIANVRQKTNEVTITRVGIVVFAGASKTFEVQLLDDGGGSTQTLTGIFMEFWRVA